MAWPSFDIHPKNVSSPYSVQWCNTAPQQDLSTEPILCCNCCLAIGDLMEMVFKDITEIKETLKKIILKVTLGRLWRLGKSLKILRGIPPAVFLPVSLTQIACSVFFLIWYSWTFSVLAPHLIIRHLVCSGSVWQYSNHSCYSLCAPEIREPTHVSLQVIWTPSSGLNECISNLRLS